MLQGVMYCALGANPNTLVTNIYKPNYIWKKYTKRLNIVKYLKYILIQPTLAPRSDKINKNHTSED